MRLSNTEINSKLLLSVLSITLIAIWTADTTAQTRSFLWAEGVSGTSNVSGHAIATDGLGNSIVTGTFLGTATFDTIPIICPGTRGIFIAKYDMAGRLIWVRNVENTSDGEGFGITVDGDENIVVTGYFEGTATFGSTNLTSSGVDDIFIAKYDSAGNVIWAKQAGGDGDDRGLCVATDGWGNVYLTGYFSSTASFETINVTSSGGTDIFVAKYDQSGDILWVKQAGGIDNTDEGWGITVDRAGNSSVT